jgi:hypothetical protein
MLERAFQNQIRSEYAKSSRSTAIAERCAKDSQQRHPNFERNRGISETSYAAPQLRVLKVSHGTVACRAACGET